MDNPTKRLDKRYKNSNKNLNGFAELTNKQSKFVDIEHSQKPAKNTEILRKIRLS